MAQGYNLTVQLNLQGPKNLNNIVNNINQRLNNIQATVNVKTSPQTAAALNQIAKSSTQVQKNADQAANSMEKFGKSAGLAIKRFGAFTAATAGFYAVTKATTQSLQRFIEYDRQLTRISQVTGTAKESLSGLSDAITQLSTSLGASSSELAQVSVTLSQAGLTAQQTKQALEALALTTLAPTFSDINQTVEGSIALMKQFTVGTRELEGALGSINAVAGQFAVEAGDIITAIQRTGGVFAAASNGVSQGTAALNEFIAVFTSVRATTRESAETIATGLRTIFTRLQREDTLDALKEFGIELTDLEGKFVGPYRAIERLAAGLRTLDPRDVQFSSLVEELGGFRQVGKVIPLIQQFTTAQQALNVAQQGSGSLAKDAAIGQQSLGVQISKVQQEFDALIRSIGQTSEFKQFIRLSLDLASALIQVADAVKPLIPAITALGAVGLARGVPSIARGFKKGIGSTGYYTGGMVRGPSGIDKVNARLTDGEYVIRKSAVQALGPDVLEQINKTGKLPGFAAGGPIQAQSLKSVALRNRITRTGTNEDYINGLRVNDLDSLNFDIRSIPVDASPRIGNTEFEKRVAATVKGKWQGGNKPVDVLGPQGPIEVRNRQQFTPPAELADKLIRHKLENGQNVLSNTMGVDDINLGRIYVAYNTGKLDEKKRQELAAKGKTRKLAPASALKGASKTGFDFREYNTGGYNLEQGEIDARLTAGEYVINPSAARSLGRKTLDKLNRADKLGFDGGMPKFHTGGSVGYIPAFNNGGAPERQRGVGSTIGLVFALQGAASLFATSIEEAASTGAAEMGAGIQGAVSGLNLGIVGGEIAGFIPGLSKFAGGIGLAAGAVAAVTTGFIRAKNASIEFADKLSKQNIEQATQKVSSALEKLGEDVNNIQAFKEAVTGIKQATAEIKAARDRQIESTRLGVTNLAEYLLGGELLGGGLTQEQRAAGTTQEQLTAQRSLVLEVKGISAYLSTLVGLAGDSDTAQENLAKEINNINKTRAQESSREFAGVAENITQLISKRLQEGDDIRDIIDSKGFKQFSEALARANPVVERFILDTQARTDISEQQKQQLISRVVAERGAVEIIQRTAAVRKQIEINNAKQIGKSLETVLSRIFENFEQAFNRTADNIAKTFDRISSDIGALSGRATTAIGPDRTSNILENPRAYGNQRLEAAVSSLGPLLGSQGQTIQNLAVASTQLEGQVLASINKAIKENPESNPEAIASIVRRDLQGIVSNLNIPPDIARILGNQISTAIGELRSKGKDKVALDTIDVRESVAGFADTIDSLKGSMDVLQQAQNSYRSALEGFVNVQNTIGELLISRNQYVERSFQILSSGAIRLSEAFGRVTDAGSVRAEQQTSLQRQTGGLSSAEDIFDRILEVNTRRNILQDSLSSAQGADSSEEFVNLSRQLTSANTELNVLQNSLKSLAESTAVADAALADIARAQQKREAQAGFLENVVSSTPEQLSSLNQAYSDLQRLLSGQANTIYTSTEAQKQYINTLRQGGNRFQAAQAAQGVLAQERGNVTALVKELGPLLGDSRAAGKLRADVLEKQLSQLGLLSPQFAGVISALRDPQADPEQARAIRIYQQAVTGQSDANDLLAQIYQINATMAEQSSAKAIADAIASTRLNVNIVGGLDLVRGVQVPQEPVRRAAGGIIYAAAGQSVEMKPKGTDTVPAMLTPGEFVVNRQAASKNRGLLENINSGKTQYYQYGGFVSPSFDNTQPRGTTKFKQFAPIEDWQTLNQNYQRYGAYSVRNFTSFTEKPPINFKNVVPQYIDGIGTLNTTQDLTRGLTNYFSNNSNIKAGYVPNLVVEKTGIFNPNVDENYVDFGTASRIARAVRELQQQNPKYQNVKLDSPSDVLKAETDGLSIVKDIETQSGIPFKVIKGYLRPDFTFSDYATGNIPIAENQPIDSLKAYLSQESASNFIAPLDLNRLGLYSAGLVSPSPLSTGGPLNEQQIAQYKKDFNKAASFIQNEPTIANIKSGTPRNKDPENPWNFNDGSYYGLYKSIASSIPANTQGGSFGPSLTSGGSSFTLDSDGNQGKLLEGISSLGPASVLETSQAIYQKAIDTRAAFQQPLEESENSKAFASNLKQLYSGISPTLPLDSSFFKNKTGPIMGLSRLQKKLFDARAAEQGVQKSENFSLSRQQGGTKLLGILRDKKQTDLLEGLEDDAAERLKLFTTDNKTADRKIILSRKGQQIPINISVPYKKYRGVKYSEQFQDFMTTNLGKKLNFTNGIPLAFIPDMAEYNKGSFLSGNGNNDIMYNNSNALIRDYLDELAISKGAMLAYMFDGQPLPDLQTFMQGQFGFKGSPIPNIFLDKQTGGAQLTRKFPYDTIQAQLDAAKEKLKQDIDKTAPEDRQGTVSAVAKYRDMMRDSVIYWGGVRGPFASTVRASDLPRGVNDDGAAIAAAQGVANIFRALGGGLNNHLYVRSMLQGFAGAFSNIDTGVLDSYTRKTGRNRVDVNTVGAAAAFAQDYFFSNVGAPGNQLEVDPADINILNDALADAGDHVANQPTLRDLFRAFANPYVQYKTTGVRTRGLRSMFEYLSRNHFYERRRRGVVPSYDQAAFAYGALDDWYDGFGPWKGQDRISKDLLNIGNDAEDRLDYFRNLRLSEREYRIANRSHYTIGGGLFGPLPDLSTIAAINNINPLFLAEGGPAMLQEALNAQAPRGSNARVASRKRQKRVNPITGQEVKMDNPLGAAVMAGGADVLGSIFDVLGVIPGGITSLVAAPGAAVEQFTGGTTMTNVMKGGLSAFTKPGSKIAEGIIGKENMTSDSYIAGASQDELIAKMLQENPTAFGIMMVTDFASPDFADAARYASFFATAFPTVKKVATPLIEGAQQGQKLAELRKSANVNIAARIAEIQNAAPKQPRGFTDRIPVLGRMLGSEGNPVLDAASQAEITSLKKLQDDLYSPPGSPAETAAIQKGLELKPKNKAPAGETGTGGAAAKTDPLEGELDAQGRYVLPDLTTKPKTTTTTKASSTDPDIQEYLAGKERMRLDQNEANLQQELAPILAKQEAQKKAAQAAAAKKAEQQELFNFARENKIAPTRSDGTPVSMDELRAMDAKDRTPILQDVLRRAKEQRAAKEAQDVEQFLKDAGLTELTESPGFALYHGGPSQLSGLKMKPGSNYQSGGAPGSYATTSKKTAQGYAAESAGGASVYQVNFPGTPEDYVRTNTRIKDLAASHLEALENISKMTGQKFDKNTRLGVFMSEAQKAYANKMPDLSSADVQQAVFSPFTASGVPGFKTNADNYVLLPGQPGPKFFNEQLVRSGPPVKRVDPPPVPAPPKYNYKNRGGMIYASNGMLLPYRPRGTDTVPAMLTPGEFVVNRDAAQKNMGLLQAINRSKGGITPKYLASGGYPSPDDVIKGNAKLQKQLTLSQYGVDDISKLPTQVRLMLEKGYGVDAAGRSVFNNPTGGYSDPRSSEKDLMEILKYGNLTSFGVGGKFSFETYAKGGIVNYLKEGGQLVDFKPKGTDTVPAMLTPGEFVINRQSAQKNMGLLKAINKNKGGMISNGVLYAAGGTEVGGPTFDDTRSALSTQRVFDGIYSAIEEMGNKARELVLNIGGSIFGSSDNTQPQPPETPENNMSTGDCCADILSELRSLPESIMGTEPANMPSINIPESIGLDTTAFDASIGTFQASLSPLATALEAVAAKDFGVINDGAATLLASSLSLGSTIGRFDQSISSFTEQTDRLIEALNFQIDGTITVGGSISVQPMTVNIAGLESIDARINGMGEELLRIIQQGLAAGNPGFNTSQITMNYTPTQTPIA